jgi:hypothetical protein
LLFFFAKTGGRMMIHLPTAPVLLQNCSNAAKAAHISPIHFRSSKTRKIPGELVLLNIIFN